jgi:glycosyltransferase involved in cell wall biosynthesis
MKEIVKAFMEPVSVIIPTYNRAAYLGRAVESVAGQRDFNGEIIIVDDGSEDNTREEVNALSRRHTIKYSYCANSGPSAARNRGVELSSCSYIAFLDSDDHWACDKLVKQMENMRRYPEYSISHTGEKWLRRGIHLNQKTIHRPRHGYIFDHCLRLCAVGMSTVVMRKEIYEEFDGLDTALPCCEDYDFWLRVSSKYRFLLIPEPLTVKEGGREDQLSHKYRVGMDKYRIYAIEKLLKEHRLTDDQRRLAVTELRKKCEIFGNGCIKHGRLKKGLEYLNISTNYSNL